MNTLFVSWCICLFLGKTPSVVTNKLLGTILKCSFIHNNNNNDNDNNDNNNNNNDNLYLKRVTQSNGKDLP